METCRPMAETVAASLGLTLEAPLSSGSWLEVWQVADAAHDRAFALLLPKVPPASDFSETAREDRAARWSAKAWPRHPNLPSVLRAGETAGRPYALARPLSPLPADPDGRRTVSRVLGLGAVMHALRCTGHAPGSAVLYDADRGDVVLADFSMPAPVPGTIPAASEADVQALQAFAKAQLPAEKAASAPWQPLLAPSLHTSAESYCKALWKAFAPPEHALRRPVLIFFAVSVSAWLAVPLIVWLLRHLLAA